MKYLDLTLPSPAENLACDEALLDACEAGAGGGDEVLRFWEPAGPSVVVGYANRVAAEVNVDACARRAVPILRRVSGGGTVVQGPGCLNYALVLNLGRDPALGSISGANRYILQRHADCLGSLLGRQVSLEGQTDLALDGRKFSGNAQRRKRHCLLFHGSFLLDLDLSLVAALLPMPSRQPGYRGNRSHPEFLMNLGLPAGQLKAALRLAWAAADPLDHPPAEVTRDLSGGRYACEAWNRRW